MSESQKIYRITFRHDATPPANWQTILSNTPGLTLLATTGRHARIEAAPEALDTLRATLGDSVMMEEEMPRYF
ncbi:MAG: hypothetical protein ABW206_03470 [Agrobacterium vaccinii]